MIELKVHCDCGQKYKFDVEPVNNQMPFTVACPICKRDGTPKANVLLQQMSVFKRVDTAPAPVSIAPAPVLASAAPPPPAPASIAPPPPAGPSKLRINAAAHAEPAAPSAGAPPPIAPGVETAPPPIGARPRLGAVPAVASDESGKKPSFAMGLLGAFVGAFVGAILYYIIYKTTGVRIFLAIGVGGLAGWLANLFGKGEGSKELGGLAAVFTVVAVLVAQYFVVLDRWHKGNEISGEISQAIQDGGYSANVTEAKEVVKAVPTGSDAEIRMYLAKQNVEQGEMPKPASISDDQVKEFHDNELPEYQDLASGKMTKEQYWAKNNFDPNEAKKLADDEESTFKGLFILLTLTRSGIFSMIAGAGLAYRLSANA